MSLINDVLRDLDARRSNDLTSPDLQREIRSLPEAPSRSSWWLISLLGFLCILVGGGWYFWPRQISHAEVQQIPALIPAQPSVLAASVELKVAQAETPLRSATDLSVLPAENKATESIPPAEREKAVRKPAEVVVPLVKPVLVEKQNVGTVEKKPVLATSRDRAEADLHTAQNLIAQERNSEAIASLRSALRNEPAYGAARQLWVKLLLEQKRFDEAISVLQEGIELQPSQIGWAMTVARLQLEKNDLPAAERSLSKSFAYASGSPAYLGFYGHIRSRLGQGREAIELYQAAARLEPGEGRWWFGLAAALESAGRSNEAREAYRQALNSGSLPSELAAIVEQRLAR